MKNTEMLELQVKGVYFKDPMFLLNLIHNYYTNKFTIYPTQGKALSTDFALLSSSLIHPTLSLSHYCKLTESESDVVIDYVCLFLY